MKNDLHESQGRHQNTTALVCYSLSKQYTFFLLRASRGRFGLLYIIDQASIPAQKKKFPNFFLMFQLRQQEAATRQRDEELKTSQSEITSLLVKV